MITDVKKIAQFTSSVFLVSVMPFSLGLAGELEITPELGSTVYHYNSQFNNDESTENQALVVIPAITGIYKSQLLQSAINIKHTNINQTDNTPDANKSYNDIKYNADLTIIENMLSISASGAQSYRAISQQQGYVVDRLLSPGELTKTRQHSANASFTTPNPKYFGLDLVSSISSVKSDRSAEQLVTNLENDTTSYSAKIYQGREFKRIGWNIALTDSQTSRANYADFESSSAKAYITLGLFSDVNLVATSSIEEYDFGEGNISGRRGNVDSTSYGLGFEWQPRPDRTFSLTYNELEEGEDKNKTQYVGVNANWAFSSRTSIALDYGKRFFGDSYKLDFQHNTKHLRSKLSYSEDVSTFATASNTGQSLGVFVCAIGSVDISECFQPDSINYELQAGEELRDGLQLSQDINEQVFLSKSGALSLGYVARKLTLGIDLNYRETEYLESIRTTKNKGVRLSASYKLGRRMDVNFGTNLTRTNTFQDNIQNREDDIFSTDLSLSRTLGENLKTTIKGRFLHRDSNNESNNIYDRRLSLSVDYTF